MKLSPAQLKLGTQLLNGARIVRRGKTMGGNDAFHVKFTNGTEKKVGGFTVGQMLQKHAIGQDLTLTPAGRKALEESA